MCRQKWAIFSLLCLTIQTIYALVDVTIDQNLGNAGFHRYVKLAFYFLSFPINIPYLTFFRLLATNITLYGNLTSCNLLLEEKFPKNFYIADSELENINNFSEVSF